MVTVIRSLGERPLIRKNSSSASEFLEVEVYGYLHLDTPKSDLRIARSHPLLNTGRLLDRVRMARKEKFWL